MAQIPRLGDFVKCFAVTSPPPRECHGSQWGLSQPSERGDPPEAMGASYHIRRPRGPAGHAMGAPLPALSFCEQSVCREGCQKYLLLNEHGFYEDNRNHNSSWGHVYGALVYTWVLVVLGWCSACESLLNSPKRWVLPGPPVCRRGNSKEVTLGLALRSSCGPRQCRI